MCFFKIFLFIRCDEANCQQIQDKLSFTRYEGEKVLKDGTIAHLHVGFIYHEYRVFEQGWHNIDIQICADEDVYLHSRLHGEVSFRNPYGYLPAEQWGIIPFEVKLLMIEGVESDRSMRLDYAGNCDISFGNCVCCAVLVK